MKNVVDFLREQLDNSYNNLNEGEVTDEKSFREYAENKFKEVFGDDLDEDQMNEIIDGLIEKNDGDWGKTVGELNKSFGS